MYTDFDFHSPSRRLALERVVDGAREILLLDAESGDSLGRIGPELFPSDPRFSPDGGRLAFFGDGRIYVHSLERGASEAVVDLAGRYAGLASWSPDGRSLAFAALAGPAGFREWSSIFRLDLADGRMVQFSDGPGLDRFPDWSADGSRLAFRRTLVDFPTYYHAMVLTGRDGAGTRQAPLPDGMSQLTSRHCWSPDGAFLVVWEGDNWKDGKGALRRRLKAFRVDDMSVAWTLEGETLLGGCFDPRGGRSPRRGRGQADPVRLPVRRAAPRPVAGGPRTAAPRFDPRCRGLRSRTRLRLLPRQGRETLPLAGRRRLRGGSTRTARRS